MLQTPLITNQQTTTENPSKTLLFVALRAFDMVFDTITFPINCLVERVIMISKFVPLEIRKMKEKPNTRKEEASYNEERKGKCERVLIKK